MPDVTLRVGGREFAGWKTARVTRSIESIAGSFDLTVSDKWGGQLEPWPILEEDECVLAIDDEVLIAGHVDQRELSYTATDHTLVVSGRDSTAALVDSSVVLDAWEFKSVPLKTLADRVCAPFGIGVVLQAGLVLPAPPAKFSVDPGDTAFDVLDRACRMAGVLPVADGESGLLRLTRAGSARASTALVEGKNILSASARYDASGRYRKYLVAGQHAGTDQLNGKNAARVKATATDESVRRADRTLLVRAEGNVTTEYAKQRAAWEATVRAARGDAVSVMVQDWKQADGTLWPVNALVTVRLPRIGVDGTMLISEATYTRDTGGTTTLLTLRRPDAFLPEPTIPPDPKTGPNAWKELAGGVR